MEDALVKLGQINFDLSSYITPNKNVRPLNIQKKFVEMKNNEIWKPIKSLKGYSVSSIGRVRRNSFEVLQNNQHGFFKRILKERILKNSIDKYGYHRITIRRKGYFVHRLVAQAFLSNPKSKKEVNHKNGIKTDNRIDNLEWCTRKENMRHALVNGLKFNHRGVDEKYYQSTIISKEQAIEAKKIYDSGTMSYNALAQKYNVSKSTMMRVIKNQVT
jgi:hypothetical protein